jgi:hypothetical protein
MTSKEEIIMLKSHIPEDQSWIKPAFDKYSADYVIKYLHRISEALEQMPKGAYLNVMDENVVVPQNRILFIQCAHYLMYNVFSAIDINFRFQTSDTELLIKRSNNS